MNLISVDSATHTAEDGLLTLQITADVGNGNESLPYGWRRGDPYGLGPQIDAWMAEHPDFPIGAFHPPIVTPDQVEAEASRRISAASADAVLRLQVLGTPIPDSVKAVAAGIDAAAAVMKAMTPIPPDYTSDSYW